MIRTSSVSSSSRWRLPETAVLQDELRPSTSGPPLAAHVDIPSFRGATRDRYPIQLLQAMGSSGLFEPWRVAEAGAVVWFCEGPGGHYDYWPDGLSGPCEASTRR